MKLHRLVVAFILASSALVLVAGLWFKPPAFPAAAAKTAPAARAAARAAAAPAPPATPNAPAQADADNLLARLTATAR